MNSRVGPRPPRVNRVNHVNRVHNVPIELHTSCFKTPQRGASVGHYETNLQGSDSRDDALRYQDTVV